MNRFTRFSLSWLLVVPLCLTALQPACAADQSQNQNQSQNQWYNVELIVFAQRHPDAGNEVWPANPGTPDMTNAQEIPTAVVPGASLEPLPPAQYQLQADEQKLANSGDYEILLHTGWRQLGVPRANAIPVHIHTAEPAASAATTPSSGATTTATGDAATTVTPSAPPLLNGVVELTVMRYLHLDVDLLYRGAPVTASDSTNSSSGFFGTTPAKPQIQIYRLTESRRMHNGELHYFDHPMFGVIALVTPYNPPPPATGPSAPSATTPGAPTPATSATPSPQSGTGMIQRN